MGYRSDVLIKLPEERWEEYKTLVKSKCEDAFDGATIHECQDYEIPEIHIFFEWVKWYPEFSDVRAIEDSLEEMREKYGMSYAFARSGEEFGDFDDNWLEGINEDKGKDVGFVCVCQYIDTPKYEEGSEIEL